MNSLRILIADDHPLFRYGLRARLSVEPHMEVVGEAETGEEAITLAATLAPNIILMDLDFKTGIDGIEATRQIRQANPGVEILVITYMESDSVFAAIKAGARGYFLKDATPDSIIDAIRAVNRGEAIYSPAIAQRVIDHFQKPHPFPDLTRREREVLVLIARGYTNAAIAQQLCIEEGTVRNYVFKIYDKLHVTSRYEAIIRAREHGLS